jgi:hypothetical protein
MEHSKDQKRSILNSGLLQIWSGIICLNSQWIVSRRIIARAQITSKLVKIGDPVCGTSGDGPANICGPYLAHRRSAWWRD